MDNEGLITRLRKRAGFWSSIPKDEPERISDILEEAAEMIECLRDDNERINKRKKELETTLSSNRTWIRGGS
jgi:hypothetical protein